MPELQEPKLEQVSTVDIQRLSSVEFDKLDDLPHKPCVYVALAGTDVLYVGSTTSLLKRLMSHHRLKDFKEHQCSRVAWAEVEVENLRSTEKKWIAYLKPLLNWKQKQTERPAWTENRPMISVVMRCWRQSKDISIYNMAQEIGIRARDVVLVERSEKVNFDTIAKVLAWLFSETNGTRKARGDK